MKIFLVFISLLSTFDISAQIPNAEKLRNLKEIKRFAFGSCNNEVSYQRLWTDMLSNRPDLFIWGGDNIYAESDKLPALIKSYSIQGQQKDYLAFKAVTPIIGTWDDHDYAYNNADGHLKIKKESQKLFLDFMDEPEDSPRRKQEGIYTSYQYGEDDKKIMIIILDNRYFMHLEKEFPLLGKAQWEWLDGLLKTSKAKLHIIVSGLSIFSPQIPFSEEWADFKKDYNKLMRTLKINETPAVLFLTGDKHFSSILNHQGYVEFLSSGLTHTIKGNIKQDFVKHNFPNYTFDHSYGLVDIEWVGSEIKRPIITLNARNEKSENVLSHKYEWGEKQYWIKK